MRRVRSCDAKHIFMSKCIKYAVFGVLLAVQVEIWHATVTRSAFSSQNAKHTMFGALFGSSEKLHATTTRSIYSSQNVPNNHIRSTFGSSDVEKLHPAMARSTFSSQNV